MYYESMEDCACWTLEKCGWLSDVRQEGLPGDSQIKPWYWDAGSVGFTLRRAPRPIVNLVIVHGWNHGSVLHARCMKEGLSESM